MADVPKYEHNNPDAKKRAYNMKVPGKESADINFNPGNNPELKKVQKSIDEARNPQEAYRIFGQFTGNNSAAYKEDRNMQTDLPSLKIKLKNMTRVILDYPELRGQIGNMYAVDDAHGPSSKDGKSYYMAADGTLGGRQKAKFYYNSVYDIPGTEDSSHSRDKRRGDSRQAGNDDFSGDHELGHVMATMLIDGNYREATRQYNYSVPENEIIDTVLSKPEIMPSEDYRNLKRFSKAEAEKDNRKKFKDKE